MRISVAKIVGEDYYIAVGPSSYPPGNVSCNLAEFYNYSDTSDILSNAQFFAGNLESYSSFLPFNLTSTVTSRSNPEFGFGMIKTTKQRGKIYLNCPGIQVKNAAGRVTQHYFGSPNFHDYNGFGLDFRLENSSSFLSIQAAENFPVRSLPALLKEENGLKYYLYSSAIPLAELNSTPAGVTLTPYSMGKIVFFRGDTYTNISQSPIYVDGLSTKDD